MANKTLIKAGDKTIFVSNYGEVSECMNRIPSNEAVFAMKLIMAYEGELVPGAVVERAFEIAKMTFAHIKACRMDIPFPFSKVYPDDKSDA